MWERRKAWVKNYYLRWFTEFFDPKSKGQGQKQTERSDLTPIQWVKNFNVHVNFFKVKNEIIPETIQGQLHSTGIFMMTLLDEGRMASKFMRI